MKTKIFILTICISFTFINVNAQFKMSTDGNSAFATSPTPWNYSKLKVDISTSNYDATISNYAFRTVNTPLSNSINYYGIISSSYYSSAVGYSKTIGIYGQAGNATSGWNYGVAGFLIGSNNGAGILGVARGYSWVGTGGNYSGFFYGDVKITNPSNSATLWVNSTSYTSDQRLKKNVSALSNTVIDKISQLNGVEYQYKSQQELIDDGIVIISDTSTFIETNDLNTNKVHFGYIAQDVQQIFPELVYEGSDGILGIDYIGFIPLMIEVIKNQNETITDLQEQIKNCCSKENISNEKSTGQNVEEDRNSETAVLYQNIPNPYSEVTSIKCDIPVKSLVSYLYIYDMQGSQIKKIQIDGTGEKIVSVKASELKPGMYLYTLIVDGKEIDTKKMILTD